MTRPQGYSVMLSDQDWLYTVVVSLEGHVLATTRVSRSDLTSLPVDQL